jgi:hypothetical protein
MYASPTKISSAHAQYCCIRSQKSSTWNRNGYSSSKMSHFLTWFGLHLSSAKNSVIFLAFATFFAEPWPPLLFDHADLNLARIAAKARIMPKRSPRKENVVALNL